MTWDELDIPALEAEVMLTGNWKNIEELEEVISLDELNLLVNALREKEHRHNRFMAALKGIDIDEGSSESAEERFERAKRRAESKLSGVSEEELEMSDFGLDITVEE